MAAKRGKPIGSRTSNEYSSRRCYVRRSHSVGQRKTKRHLGNVFCGAIKLQVPQLRCAPLGMTRAGGYRGKFLRCGGNNRFFAALRMTA